MNNPLPPSTHDYIQELTRSNNDFKSLLHKTQTYRQAFANYKNYQNWKKNRNPARAAMEAKVGYDTKYSMHLIRLLNMGLEILLLKEVNVYREDKEMLLEIRNGEWEYDRLIKYADSLFEQLDEAYKVSTLPHSVDINAINDLQMEILDIALAPSKF